MNIIIDIEGREAIPLRAVPYLSAWRGMTPDGLACALAGDEMFFQFEGMLAYRLEGHAVKPIRTRDWDAIVLRMEAADDRIEHAEISHNEGKERSRREILCLLPPGAFVWRDEFEPRYRKKYLSVPHFDFQTEYPIGRSELADLVALDFDPFIPESDTISEIMEGFGPLKAGTQPQVEQDAPAEAEPNGSSASIFSEMAGLTASEIALAFVGDKPESGLGANNMLEVSARGEKRRIPLASLDLVRKDNGNPNGECGVLLGLSQGRAVKKSSANTSKMKRLRLVFLNHFGIVRDPFEPYMESAGWRPLFTISDKRGAADARAKKEAEARMVSLEQLAEQGRQPRDRSNEDADDWMTKNGHEF